VLLSCLLLLCIVTIPYSATLPFWYDELFTVQLSDLPHFGLVMQALSEGVDAQPPVLYIVTRAARKTFGNSELATRIPALVGFALLTTCLFWFVGRRTSALWGAVAVLIVMVTRAQRFAHEARPYGLYLGFSALALLCWQFAAEGRYRKLALVGLWLSLTLAVSSHYYAVLVLLPLFLGEGARSLRNRRVDWPVLLCIAFAGLVILFYLPLINGEIRLASHPAMLARPAILWGTFAFVFADATVPLGLSLVALILVMETRGESRSVAPGLSLAESVACIGFLTFPLSGFLLAYEGGLELTERHLLPVVIGAAVLIACGFWKAAKRRTAAAVLLILVLGGWFAGWNAIRMGGLVRPGQFDLPDGADSDSIPLVIANPLTFLQYLYYGTPADTSRVLYVAEPALALQYVGTDTMDRNLQLAQPYFSLPLITWTQLRREYPRFQMLASPSPFVWLPDKIKAEGARMTLLSVPGQVLLLEVSWDDRSHLDTAPQ
jgi:hypothetical protein